jgi:hypothetical protein
VTISYDEAKKIVVRVVSPTWDHGTFCLDDRQITETDTAYVFRVGAREYIVDGDDSFAVPGGIPVVRKADGTFEWLASVTVAMDPTARSRPNPDPMFSG